MVVRGAGPEDAALRVDLLVADAGIVGRPALAGAAQLLEDLARTGVAKAVTVPEASGDVAQYFDIRPRARRRGLGAAAVQHAALEIRHRSFFLGPLRRGQDDVRQRCRLGEEEVGYGEEIERAQPLFDPPRVRRGHDGVRTDDQQRTHAARLAQRREQLVGRAAGARDLLLLHVPDLREVAPGSRIVDAPVPGELVRLLPVLAAALSVALSGETAVTGEGLARLAQGERDVDEGERVGDALRLLLGPAAGKHHRAARAAQHPRRLDELRLGHARDALHPVRPVAGHGG